MQLTRLSRLPNFLDFVRQLSDITFTLPPTTTMPTDTAEPDLFDLLDDLNGTVKSLGSSAAPLTSSTVQDISTHLTVADKARLYVLTTYAIESLLFGILDGSSCLQPYWGTLNDFMNANFWMWAITAYLRLNGTDVKDHPIRTELSRVRNYVQKIKEAQAAPRDMALDKEAAGRFIKAALVCPTPRYYPSLPLSVVPWH